LSLEFELFSNPAVALPNANANAVTLVAIGDGGLS
jgi:hypothetical protein